MEDSKPVLNWRNLVWHPSQSDKGYVNLVGRIIGVPAEVLTGERGIRTSISVSPLAPEYEEVQSDLRVRVFIPGEFSIAELQEMDSLSRNGGAINVSGTFIYRPDAEYLGYMSADSYEIIRNP